MNAITKFRELVAPKKSSADRRKRKEALLSDHIDILVQIETAEQARNAELADSDKETRQRHRETIKALREDLKDVEDSIAVVDTEIAEAETAKRVIARNAEADQLDKANAEVTKTYLAFEKEWQEKWGPAFDKAAEVDARTRAFNKGLLEGERRVKSAEETMRWLPFIRRARVS